MKMRTVVWTAAAPMLLGCILFLAATGLGVAEDMMQSSSGSHAAAEPGIVIRNAEEASQAEQGTWTYDIINTGNVKLTNVRVTDDRFTAISCQQDALEVGESMACTASAPSAATEIARRGCAVADHVVVSEAGVMVTTKGDCADEADGF